MSNRVRANQRKQQLSESGIAFTAEYLVRAAALAEEGAWELCELFNLFTRLGDSSPTALQSTTTQAHFLASSERANDA